MRLFSLGFMISYGFFLDFSFPFMIYFIMHELIKIQQFNDIFMNPCSHAIQVFYDYELSYVDMHAWWFEEFTNQGCF